MTRVELIGAKLPSAEALDELAQRFPKQEKAIAYLQKAGGPVELREFLNRTGLSRSPLDSLQKRGWVRFSKVEESSLPFLQETLRDQPPQLTEQQQAELGHALARALRALLEMLEASAAGNVALARAAAPGD